MTVRISEYDAFGPWVIAVEDPLDVPPLFADGTFDPSRTLAAIKVPRHVERREASPDMNLYDVMLTLTDDDVLTVHRRVDESHQVQRFDLSDVRATRIVTELLHASYTVTTPTEEITVTFSSGSVDEVRAFDSALLGRTAASAPPRSPRRAGSVDLDAFVDRAEHRFHTAHLNTVRRVPEAVLLAAQHPADLPAPTTSVWRRIVATVFPRALNSTLVYDEGPLLELVGRSRTTRQRRREDLSFRTERVPLSSVVGVTVVADPDHEGVTLTVLDIGAQRSPAVAFSDPADAHQLRSTLETTCALPG